MLKAFLILLGSLVVAMSIAIAEFGVDPGGFGEKTGLIRLYEAKFEYYLLKGQNRNALRPLSSELSVPDDEWQISLGPFESIEFKYEVEQGTVILFTWLATAPLHFDMHAHPFEGGEALTESYIVDESPNFSGQYTAGFTGLHGWYWQNRKFETVMLTLRVEGKVEKSLVYQNGGVITRYPTTKMN